MMLLLLLLLPLQSVAWKTVSVEDYGAVGDNQTDNTKAFRSALLAVAEDGGGEVVVPCKYLRTTSSLLLYTLPPPLHACQRCLRTSTYTQYHHLFL